MNGNASLVCGGDAGKIEPGPIVPATELRNEWVTSHQRRFVTPRGKQWYGYFRKVVNDPVTAEEKIHRVTVILGLRSQMSKGEAREALQREITKQLGQAGSANRITND